jgi:UDP-glucose 4-epimerase
MRSRQKRIVVTGGAGFIGSYVCEELLRRKHEVVAIDTSSGAKVDHLRSNPRFHFIQSSIADAQCLDEELQKASMVFHLAAIADPKQYVLNPLSVLNINLRCSIELFRLAARHGVKVIFTSTSEIYGVNPRIPWKETDQRVLGSTHISRWCYSTAKAACEHYLYALAKEEGLRFVIYRFFNVYGPRLDDLGDGRVMTMFLKNFLLNKPVEVHGDGKQTRTFFYVTDAVDAVVRLAFLKRAEGQVFNIGNDREVTILELANRMKKVGKFKSPIRLVSYHKAFGDGFEDVTRRCPDISKIKQYIHWRPKVGLDEGLRRIIDYYSRKVGISL